MRLSNFFLITVKFKVDIYAAFTVSLALANPNSSFSCLLNSKLMAKVEGDGLSYSTDDHYILNSCITNALLTCYRQEVPLNSISLSLLISIIYGLFNKQRINYTWFQCVKSISICFPETKNFSCSQFLL